MLHCVVAFLVLTDSDTNCRNIPVFTDIK